MRSVAKIVCRFGMLVCVTLAAAAARGDAVSAKPTCALTVARQQSAAAVVREAAGSGFGGTVVVEGCGRLLVDEAAGWADARRKRTADGDTLYHVASVTKFITAIVMLKLVEEGRLLLTDTVGRSFPDAPADKAAITVDQLLLHQSGLGQNYAADGHTERDEAVRAILATPLAFPPGTGQKYSNDGMNLLAAIAEKATGEPYAALVHRRVLAPAGLKRTLLWEEVVPGRTANLAVPPLQSDDGPRPGRNWGMMGGDGLWSNARELARLMRALTQGKVLSEASLAALAKARLDTRDGDFTNYGWFTRAEPNQPRLLWTRGTEQDGFNAALYWYPDHDLIIAIASNVGPFESERVTVSRALALRLEKALLW
jgi:CubicO group peptidase (beta-lactamase class C family)